MMYRRILLLVLLCGLLLPTSATAQDTILALTESVVFGETGYSVYYPDEWAAMPADGGGMTFASSPDALDRASDAPLERGELVAQVFVSSTPDNPFAVAPGLNLDGALTGLRTHSGLATTEEVTSGLIGGYPTMSVDLLPDDYDGGGRLIAVELEADVFAFWVLRHGPEDARRTQSVFDAMIGLATYASPERVADDLPQTATFDDGAYSVNYPAAWLADPINERLVYIANTETALTALSQQTFVLQPGEVLVQIAVAPDMVGGRPVEPGLSLADAVRAFIAATPEGCPLAVEHAYNLVAVDDETPFATVNFQMVLTLENCGLDAELAGHVYVTVLPDGAYGFLAVFTLPDEVHAHRGLPHAMLATLGPAEDTGS